MSLKPRTFDSDDFDRIWTQVLETIKKVVVGEWVSRVCWSEIFEDIYKLCVCLPEPFGDRLYGSTNDTLEEHVTGQLEVRINNCTASYLGGGVMGTPSYLGGF